MYEFPMEAYQQAFRTKYANEQANTPQYGSLLAQGLTKGSELAVNQFLTDKENQKQRMFEVFKDYTGKGEFYNTQTGESYGPDIAAQIYNGVGNNELSYVSDGKGGMKFATAKDKQPMYIGWRTKQEEKQELIDIPILSFDKKNGEYIDTGKTFKGKPGDKPLVEGFDTTLGEKTGKEPANDPVLKALTAQHDKLRDEATLAKQTGDMKTYLEKTTDMSSVSDKINEYNKQNHPELAIEGAQAIGQEPGGAKGIINAVASMTGQKPFPTEYTIKKKGLTQSSPEAKATDWLNQNGAPVTPANIQAVIKKMGY